MNMISSNALYDLYFSFVLIRDDIHYDLNIQILRKIEQTIMSGRCENNSLRSALAGIVSIDPQKWGFVFHQNYYTYTELIKDEQFLGLLIEACKELCWLITHNEYEQAYAFVDAVHFLPVLIIKSPKKAVRLFKKIVKPYTKKRNIATLPTI